MPNRQRDDLPPIGELLSNAGFLRAIIGRLCDSYHIFDLIGNLHYSSPPIKSTAGERQMTFRKLLRLVDDRDRMSLHRSFRAAVNSGDSVTVEFRYVSDKQETTWMETKLIPVPDERGDYAFIVAAVYNVDERKRVELDLSHKAFHDALTGLPNRILFHEHLTQALLHAKRTRQMVAVLYLDIDDFKLVNDTMGHHAGDAYLRVVADRIKGCLRQSDSFARMGGDEFTILLSMVDSLESVVSVVKRIFQSLQTPWTFEGHSCVSTVSMGISLSPIHSDDAATLLKMSDIALYQVKKKGRNGFKFFSGM